MKRELWEKIEELYNAALKLSPELRAEFLAEAAAGDDPLKAEVESLLQSREKRGDFLDTPFQNVENPLEHQREAEGLIDEPSMHAIVRQVASNMALSDKSALAAGETFSHYRIVDKLGQGGMGEVYHARDLTLGRDVAIKLLPEGFAGNADRIARFQREAKLLAALNHPNIAAIYGLEESGGKNFLVLELAEGETLGDRLKRGPIAVEESLNIALQIAEALDAAHQKGVIHRDLKPANIMITPEGKVKLLDFSVAKAFAEEQVDCKMADSPALNAGDTQPGVIMGTAAYMSPEQAQGRIVDKRTDIWAFGCVLYEMLTGKQAWTGATWTDIIEAILTKEPDFGSLPPNLHPDILKTLGRCLQKDPSERSRDIGDLRIDIKQVLAESKGVSAPPVAAAEPRRKLRTIFPWAAATLVLGLIIAGVAVWKLKPSEPRQVVRLYYDLPKEQQFAPLSLGMLALSADGKQFIYSAHGGLYLRSVDELDAKLIIGTGTNPINPFFSPDGKWVGYYSLSERKLKKIAITGGVPAILCDSQTVSGASWNIDNTIVYGEFGRGIMRLSANGGNPELLVKLTGLYLESPQILPDRKTLLFTHVMPDKSQICVQSLRTGQRKVLIEGDSARYLSTGHLVYTVRNHLVAVPFDLSRLEVTGSPVPLVDGVFREGLKTVPQFAVSDSGMLVFVPGSPSSGGIQRTLAWVDRNGKEEPLAASINEYSSPRISPDGTRVALRVANGGKGDIWIWDIIRQTMTRLTFDEASAYPLWTHDGKRIAFCSAREDKTSGEVYWKAADGAGEDEKIGSAPNAMLLPFSLSSDGKTLVLTEVVVGSGGLTINIGALSTESDHKYKLLLKEQYYEAQPKISHDGRWMAYMSSESGEAEIYVRPFPELNKGRWQVSTGGGDSPLWSPDCRELFYRHGDSIMAVAVETEPTFKAGKPEALFRGAYSSMSTAILDPWDINPDGKRFLIMKEVGSTITGAEGPRTINIVLNWLEELKQRVPAK